jgi:hypothetical protein
VERYAHALFLQCILNNSVLPKDKNPKFFAVSGEMKFLNYFGFYSVFYKTPEHLDSQETPE